MTDKRLENRYVTITCEEEAAIIIQKAEELGYSDYDNEKVNYPCDVYFEETDNIKQYVFASPVNRAFNPNFTYLPLSELLAMQPVEEGSPWIKCSDRLPTKEDANEEGKILLYRQTNEGQLALKISIYDWAMVKYCEVETTHWMPLPPPPKTQ